MPARDGGRSKGFSRWRLFRKRSTTAKERMPTPWRITHLNSEQPLINMIYMLVFAKTFSVYLRKEVKNLPSTTKTGSGSHAKSLGNPTARVRFKSRTSSKKFDFSRILQYSSRIPRILFQNLLKAMSGACRGHSIFYSHPRPSEDDQNPNPPIYVDVL